MPKNGIVAPNRTMLATRVDPNSLATLSTFNTTLCATIPFLGIDYEKIQDSIREIFQRKGDAIVELNLKALAAGKEIAEKTG